MKDKMTEILSGSFRLFPDQPLSFWPFFGKWLPKKYVSYQACLSVLASFVHLCRVSPRTPQVSPESLPLVKRFSAGSFPAFSAPTSPSQLDPLSMIMALVVTGVGSSHPCLFVGYMPMTRATHGTSPI